MITELILFIFFWFIFCGMWHETMHLFECERQIPRSSKMWLVLKPIPSMHYTVSACTNILLIRHAGGMYSSFTASLLSILFALRGDMYISFILLGLAGIQFAYGLLEGSGKIGLRYRYIIYIIGIILIIIGVMKWHI